ncbi:uncharacterized protein [Amphiura filiformis]|uniref:uncharacterized protein isoform X2 n=1 Tax=Amphiura filiformis TaxID=82378 RepID=UPI003B21E12F
MSVLIDGEIELKMSETTPEITETKPESEPGMPPEGGSEFLPSGTDASHQSMSGSGSKGTTEYDEERQWMLKKQKDSPLAASCLRFLALCDQRSIDIVDQSTEGPSESQAQGTVSHADEFLLAYGYRVRIYLLDTDDIKQEKCDGLFNFIYPEDRDELTDADGIMEAAGEMVKQEYETKKQNGDARRGVIVTSAGNLPQKKIFHIEMIRNESKAKDSVSAALRKADKEEMKSVAIPPLREYGLDYMLKREAFQLGILRMMLFEFEFKENPVCLHLIITAPTERNSREKMVEEMRCYAGGSGSLGSHYYTQ